MSEKTYRIKPLVWEAGRLTSGKLFGWFGSGVDFRGGVGYAIRHDNRSTKRPWKCGDNRYMAAAEAKADCQHDYESRLVAAGVLEEVKS